MKAGIGFCRRPLLGALAVGMLVLGTSAFGQEIRFMPIRSSPLGSPVGTVGDPISATFNGTCWEYKIDRGGVDIDLDIQASGWGQIDCRQPTGLCRQDPGDACTLPVDCKGCDEDADCTVGTCTDNGATCLESDGQGGFSGSGDPCINDSECMAPETCVGRLAPCTLGAIQATVDSAGYINGVGGDLNAKGWPGSPSDGAYQKTKACGGPDGDGRPCSAPFGPCTPLGMFAFCLDNDGGTPALNQFVMPLCTESVNAIATPTEDYAWATAAATDCNADPGVVTTMGGLILEVPSDAKGTYLIDFDGDANSTFMTSGGGSPIRGVVFTPACITVIVGKCCFNIGKATAGCADGVTIDDCDALNNALGAGDPKYDAGDATCDGPELEDDCPSCDPVAQTGCDDRDACTDDFCNSDGTCSNTLNHDPLLTCCNSNASRDNHLTVIDDGDVCTDNICNADGSVSHPFNTAPCDDNDACTEPDTCDQGDCIGTVVSGVAPCTVDEDCIVGACRLDLDDNGVFDTCECVLCTPVVINISAGNAWDPNCFADGEIINAQIALGFGSQQLFGGQFLMNYDESCVELLSVESCPNTPFPNVMDWEAGGGTVWWAATADLTDPQSTKGPGDIVCMEFRKLPGCDGCEMCFDSINPRNTLLTNTTGNPVEICPGDECSKVFRGRGTIDLITPPDVSINADCGAATGQVDWDHPSATDSCDGELNVTCVSAHDSGLLELQGAVDLLTWTGGLFPQGVSFFRCEATNSCHDTSVSVWTVDVSDQHGLHVEVELVGGMNTGMFWRAIDFQLYDNLCSDPTEMCEVLTFGGPFNFPRHARAWLKTDKGNYDCISAKDRLHTLRSCADIECVDNAWSATFKGDAVLGGNGLVGGNLDCWKDGGHGNTIDVLDAGVYLGIIARNDADELWHDSHTSCGQAGPDGDINADGHTDIVDYSFILENFLRASKICCCDSEAAMVETPIISITVKELRAMGWPELIAADINGDGVLDTTDMALYMEGHLPVMQVKSQKRAASTR